MSHQPVVSRAEAVLTVMADGVARGIPRAMVRRIDFAGQPTPVPFAVPPVEGLASIDGEPVVQIGLGRGCRAASGGKLVVVENGGALVALRVDAILPSGAAAVSLLDLDGLLSGLVPAAPPTVPAARPAAARARRPIPMLFAVGGGESVAFPAVTVERVDRVDALPRQHEDGQDFLLARLGGELLPAHSLAARLGRREEAEPAWAIVIRHGDERFALMAGGMLGLRDVAPEHIRRIEAPDRPVSFWYDDSEAGTLTRILDPRAWSWGENRLDDILADLPTVATAAARIEAALRYKNGLCVRCGPTWCVLPLTLVAQVVGRLDALPEGTIRDGTRPGRGLAVLDGGVLLGWRDTPRRRGLLGVVLTAPDGRLALLGVDEIGAMPAAPGGARPLPPLAGPLPALCDAVLYDEERWVFRARGGDRLARLARPLVRRLGMASPGWIGRDDLAGLLGL